MKKILISTWVLTVIAFAQLSAQNYTLQNTRQMAPGIIYHYYTMTTPFAQQIHVLRVDLKDPTVKLQAAKAFDKINGGIQTVKAIAAAKVAD
jgi:hypothetical protein